MVEVIVRADSARAQGEHQEALKRGSAANPVPP